MSPVVSINNMRLKLEQGQLSLQIINIFLMVRILKTYKIL